MSLGNSLVTVLSMNCLIIYLYVLFRPKNIFHPNNIIFAFSFLYIVLPSSIQLIYDVFNLPYLLPWKPLYDWYSYELSTYYTILIVYLIFYVSFYIFNQRDFPPSSVSYVVNGKVLFLLFMLTNIMLLFYMQATGGVFAWVNGYKEAFLLGREGHGLLNFVMLFSVNLLVFLLGLYFYEKKGWLKFSVLLISLLLIVFASLLQGLKSRIIILLVIFFFPYLLQLRLKLSVVLLYGVLFFILLFIGNYIRTDGFYNGFLVFVEYMMSYFNVYGLHDMIVTKAEPAFFSTLHHVAIKPLIALDLVSPDSEYDISVMLTKEYFPLDWETMQATQQWPLVTELYYNYYGFLLGWLPLIIYAYILSGLYKKVKAGNIAVTLIFLLEFFRLFTVQRGVLIPWQMPMYLFFYIVIYFVLKKSVKTYRQGINR